MLNDGFSQKEIGEKLNRCRALISREINRHLNEEKKYNALTANRAAHRTRTDTNIKKRRLFSDEELKEIKNGLESGISMSNLAKKYHTSYYIISKVLGKSGVEYPIDQKVANIESKIDALTTQFELIIELIQEIKNVPPNS